MTALPTITRRRASRTTVVVLLAVLAAVVAAWALIAVDRGPFAVLEQRPLPVATESEDDEDDVEDTSFAAALPVTVDVFVSRDPFEPVVEEPEPTSDAPGEPGDPNGDPTSPGDPTVPGDPSAPSPTDPGSGGLTPVQPPSATGTCESGVEVVCQGRVLTLEATDEDAEEPVALVTVDGQEQALRRGDVFAGNFVLRGFDDGCVAVTYVAEDGSGGIFQLCSSADPLK
ncbi:MAG: hypothetical protein JJT89_14675 [Nitriliruptoraceae bacterium]|nr:hypothetical protein [Nitriliruptoraceae bacterium]